MEKVKILLDTDMGRDCDDAGALAVLHNFEKKGKASILAVTHCASEISGAVSVKAINEWYQRPEIPVGRYDKRTFLEEEICKVYTKPLMERYLETHEKPEFENAVRVQRRALAQNEDVTIVTIGMLNNIAELLKSEPDDISPLSGVELVKKSVGRMYAMAGNFKDSSYMEYNVRSDVESAQYVTENFPAPIFYCGFELGDTITTGKHLKEASDEHPIRFSYCKYCCTNGPLHFSWDPVTVYCAVEQDTTLYKKSDNLCVTFDDAGRTVISGEGKDCYYIADASDEQISAVIDEWMR